MAYASKTSVSPEKSRLEIERTLKRYGASAFMYGTEGFQAVIQFKIKGWQIRFILQLPKQSNFRTVSQYEQAVRQRWRALLLVVKAKLESVESSITTIEQEFLPFIVCSDGTTVGDRLLPQLEQVALHGKPLLMLPPAGRS